MLGVFALVQKAYVFLRSMFPVNRILIRARFLGLPPWATKFVEMVLMLTTDHGPAVSGAMNTIVATRAGKDLISSLASGLLTIGSRSGGVLDDAASMFSDARDTGLTSCEFIDQTREQHKLSTYLYRRLFYLSWS
jgi:citrate synthase